MGQVIIKRNNSVGGGFVVGSSGGDTSGGDTSGGSGGTTTTTTTDTSGNRIQQQINESKQAYYQRFLEKTGKFAGQDPRSQVQNVVTQGGRPILKEGGQPLTRQELEQARDQEQSRLTQEENIREDERRLIRDLQSVDQLDKLLARGEGGQLRIRLKSGEVITASPDVAAGRLSTLTERGKTAGTAKVIGSLSAFPRRERDIGILQKQAPQKSLSPFEQAAEMPFGESSIPTSEVKARQQFTTFLKQERIKIAEDKILTTGSLSERIDVSMARGETSAQFFEREGIKIDPVVGLKSFKIENILGTFANVQIQAARGFAPSWKFIEKRPVQTAVGLAAVGLTLGAGTAVIAGVTGVSASVVGAGIGGSLIAGFGIAKEFKEPGSVTTLPGLISTTTEFGTFALFGKAVSTGIKLGVKGFKSDLAKAEAQGKLFDLQAKPVLGAKGGKVFEYPGGFRPKGGATILESTVGAGPGKTFSTPTAKAGRPTFDIAITKADTSVGFGIGGLAAVAPLIIAAGIGAVFSKGRGSRKRVSPKSQVQRRKESLRQFSNPNLFLDTQKGEIGIRKGKELFRIGRGQITKEIKQSRGEIVLGEKIVSTGALKTKPGKESIRFVRGKIVKEVTPRGKGISLEEKVVGTRFDIQLATTKKPKARFTFNLESGDVRKELIFPSKQISKGRPSSQAGSLVTRRQASKEFGDFLSGSGGLKGVLILARSQKVKPFSFVKRQPVKVASGESTISISRLKPTTKGKGVIDLSAKSLFAGDVKFNSLQGARPGFRRGQFEKLRGRLGPRITESNVRRFGVFGGGQAPDVISGFFVPGSRRGPVNLPSILGERSLGFKRTGTGFLSESIGTKSVGGFSSRSVGPRRRLKPFVGQLGGSRAGLGLGTGQIGGLIVGPASRVGTFGVPFASFSSRTDTGLSLGSRSISDVKTDVAIISKTGQRVRTRASPLSAAPISKLTVPKGGKFGGRDVRRRPTGGLTFFPTGIPTSGGGGSRGGGVPGIDPTPDPRIIFPSSEPRKRDVTKKKKGKRVTPFGRGFKYTSTVQAGLFNLRGKRKKSFSGLELRKLAVI